MDTENKKIIKPTEKTQNSVEEEKPATKIKRQATQDQLDHPLHGVKLAEILESLVEQYGWKYLYEEVKILCFKHNPTMKVSLKFLRKFQWAREHVEDIYMRMLEDGIDPKAKTKT